MKDYLIKKTNFKVQYKNTIYTRPSDLAKVVGQPTALIKGRWHDGVRDINKLIAPSGLSTVTENTGHPIKIIYKGLEYESLKAFAKDNKLSYHKVLNLTHQGIWQAERLIELAKPQKNLVKNITLSSKKSQKIVTDYIHNQNLLTVQDISNLLKIKPSVLFDRIHRIAKGENNYLGIEQSDVILLSNREEVQKNTTLINERLLPKYAFSQNVIAHIEKYKNKKNKLVQIPFKNNNYFYDLNTKSVWSTNKGQNSLKRISSSHNMFRLHYEGGFEEYSSKAIEDIIKYPEITGNDLMTKSEIMKQYKITKSFWNNHKINQLLGIKHTRYNKSKKITGWTKKTVDFKLKEADK